MTICCAININNCKKCTNKANNTTDEGLFVCKKHKTFKLEYIDTINKNHIEKEKKQKLREG
jgi:DNA-dependent RNA polymerase auxiliary subunit epsilon